ncbi:hypothetical protein CR513_02629, partial [Mucuna pruriens]
MSGVSKSFSSFSSLSSSSNSGAIVTTPVAMAKGVISGSSSSLGLGEEHFEWVHEDVLSYHSDMADFEVESLSQQEEWVLRTIGIAPSQLHPNGWAALQAFRIVCQALTVTPFASVFLNHYTIRVGKKVGWVSLAPLPNTSLFTTYTTSYKGFKNRFLNITALGEASFCSDR